MAAGPRERYRRQVRAEALEHAWAQVEASGAAGLSVNAIAKSMGISGPALYRYFSSRDELITELITEAYQGMADAMRAAAAGSSKRDRVAALAGAVRRWALEMPHRYFLIYGTPVPGYHAPPQTTAIARSMMDLLLEAFRETEPKRALRFWTRLHGTLSLELAGQFEGMGLDPAALYAAEVEAL